MTSFISDFTTNQNQNPYINTIDETFNFINTNHYYI